MWYDQYAAALEDEKMPAELAASVSVLPMACSLHRVPTFLPKGLQQLALQEILQIPDTVTTAGPFMLTRLTPCFTAATPSQNLCANAEALLRGRSCCCHAYMPHTMLNSCH